MIRSTKKRLGVMIRNKKKILGIIIRNNKNTLRIIIRNKKDGFGDFWLFCFHYGCYAPLLLVASRVQNCAWHTNSKNRKRNFAHRSENAISEQHYSISGRRPRSHNNYNDH